MVDSKRYSEWLDKAGRDLKSAKVLKQNDCGNDVVAFHCQQAIEKSLKGYLLKQTGKVAEGHSLIHLCKESSNYYIEFKNWLKDCALLISIILKHAIRQTLHFLYPMRKQMNVFL